MIFPYRLYDVGGASFVGRPEVPTRILSGSASTYFWALIDTGADHTILPMSYATAAGVNIDQGPTAIVGGFAGGEADLTFQKISLQIGHSTDTIQWNAKVGFIDFENPEDEIAILGHIGCLEFLRATFDGEKSEVELLPTGQLPGIFPGNGVASGPDK